MARKTIDRTGRKYGWLTVKSYVGVRKNRSLWLCQCVCGNEKIVSAQDLSAGTKSCGCKRRLNGLKIAAKLFPYSHYKGLSRPDEAIEDAEVSGW